MFMSNLDHLIRSEKTLVRGGQLRFASSVSLLDWGVTLSSYERGSPLVASWCGVLGGSLFHWLRLVARVIQFLCTAGFLIAVLGGKDNAQGIKRKRVHVIHEEPKEPGLTTP